MTLMHCPAYQTETIEPTRRIVIVMYSDDVPVGTVMDWPLDVREVTAVVTPVMSPLEPMPTDIDRTASTRRTVARSPSEELEIG